MQIRDNRRQIQPAELKTLTPFSWATSRNNPPTTLWSTLLITSKVKNLPQMYLSTRSLSTDLLYIAVTKRSVESDRVLKYICCKCFSSQYSFIWTLIQVCFVDQQGVGPLIRNLTDEWSNSLLVYETDLY